jgi:predicted Zn-dependent protease
MLKKGFFIFFLLFVTDFFSSCATSPTGRKQLLLMPESQMDAMGAQAFSQMKSKGSVERNAALNAYIRCVALPVAAAAKESIKVKEWEVVLFRDSTANAFALPGGKIGVHTGILKIAKTDGQLAAVLGHEVGHVIAHHGNERVSEGLAAQGGLAIVGALNQDHPNRELILGALGLGAQFGILLPHSRDHESEADLIGLDLMARAGFDPRESVALWKNMANSGGGAPPEFMSTHPSHETRISNLEAHIPEVLSKFEQALQEGKQPHCIGP